MAENSETHKTIIIVDDEKNIGRSFADYFEDREWGVTIAESGEEALGLLQQKPCSAAVVDIRMTGMNGEAFIREAHKAFPRMVFVICTGSLEFDMSEDILNNKQVVRQVFAKPVPMISRIEESILQLLDKNQG